MSSDWTNTERDAGLAAQTDAYPVDDRDHDNGERREPHCNGDCGDPRCPDVIVWATVRRDKDRDRAKDWAS